MVGVQYTPPLSLPMLRLVANQNGLICLAWQPNWQQPSDWQVHWQSASELSSQDVAQHILLQTISQLNEYFAGQRQQFDVPLNLQVGTVFQQTVWQVLCDIPYGQTISYARLAQLIGKPTAYRACANANGKNPISIIIPCHRVIASDGGIGGYTGGLDIKQKLLQIECSFP
ncbi:methylated-DNA--[protein]-cysteine S-methyltransferase [Moraxella nasicaprae]|uniref:Methylated-DNA--protein-cysteine methyltransferase n=1 Tax=Moraxella nasicaprae TaxID=2904122 RepID=A0ABY6F706_9GAMM|nr:methylated-DNA--[protein]-cysteine S-methyltransferase [Moraxella nasicaprae]UXZ05869.1 methylated-DNA--[protein]-cysteine S-methyltransferase [Moraxella nasicaprae]